MSHEHTNDSGEVDPAELARVTVVGKTVLDLMFQGNSHSFAEDVGIGYEYYVLPGKTQCANSMPITDQDISNLSAVHILLKLPAQLTLPGKNPYRPGIALQPPLTQDKKNIWAKPTVQMLKDTGLYATANRPSRTLRRVAPAIKEFGYAARFPEIREQKLAEAQELLPKDNDFQESFAEMSAQAEVFVSTRPTVNIEVVDVVDFKNAVQAFDPAETAPNDITESAWDLADITRGIPTHIKRVSAYHDLRVHNAAAYLGTLLFDIEKLSQSLSQK